MPLRRFLLTVGHMWLYLLFLPLSACKSCNCSISSSTVKPFEPARATNSPTRWLRRRRRWKPSCCGFRWLMKVPVPCCVSSTPRIQVPGKPEWRCLDWSPDPRRADEPSEADARSPVRPMRFQLSPELWSGGKRERRCAGPVGTGKAFAFA